MTRRRTTMNNIHQMLGDTQDDGRPEHDFYNTRPEAVHSLLAMEQFSRVIWEPACGQGAIVKVLQEHNYDIFASDLYEYETDIHAHFGLDFFETFGPITNAQGDVARDIITNPPFKIAERFAYRAVEHIEDTGGKVAFLCRLAWLESLKRMDLFRNTPIARIYVFSRRLPMMHRPNWEGKKSTSAIAYAWFVWDDNHHRANPPVIDWIDWKNHVPNNDNR